MNKIIGFVKKYWYIFLFVFFIVVLPLCFLFFNSGVTFSVENNNHIYVNLNEDAKGHIELLLQENSYYGILNNNGSCVFNIPNLRAGVYEVTIIYHGDSKYNSFNKAVILNTNVKIHII